MTNHHRPRRELARRIEQLVTQLAPYRIQFLTERPTCACGCRKVMHTELGCRFCECGIPAHAFITAVVP